MKPGPLGLDADALSSCVQCGLCLPHCPTYRVTGDERRSPRGRIALMRAVERDGAAPDQDWYDAFDTCVGCLGCETACPSAVPYGYLINATRSAITSERRPPFKLLVGLRLLSWPRLLRWGSKAIAVVQRLGLLRRTGLLPDRIPFRSQRAKNPGSRNLRSGEPAEVVLFTGCVMDVWQPSVHAAVIDVLNAAGIAVERSGDAAGCCGALHEHAGLTDDAVSHALRVTAALSDGRPVLVDSAGCGAALKHYGRLLGSKAANEFSSRVYDIHEWCVDDSRVSSLVASVEGRTGRPTVVVQDPCHLRHDQKCHDSVRDLLRPIADLIELDDEGLCCGAGGAYQLLQPDLAQAARARKVASVHRAIRSESSVTLVSANPGCMLHLSGDSSLVARGVAIRHPMEVVADRLLGAGMRENVGRVASSLEVDLDGR